MLDCKIKLNVRSLKRTGANILTKDIIYYSLKNNLFTNVQRKYMSKDINYFVQFSPVYILLISSYHSKNKTNILSDIIFRLLNDYI